MADDDQQSDEDLELPDLPKLVSGLDELVRQGSIAPERASFARQKIEELHAALSKSKGIRRKLTNDSIDLSLRLQAEIESLKKTMQLQADDETTLYLLREDAETAENESIFCREREQSLVMEEADLVRTQEEFQNKIAEIEAEHVAALAPQMLQLKMDIEGLKRQIQEGTSKIDQCSKEIDESKENLSQLLTDMQKLQSQKKVDFELLSTFDGVPEKLRKQGDALVSAVKGLHVQEQRQHDKEQSVSELKKELEMASLEADQYLADRVNYDMQLKSAQTDYKHEQEVLSQHAKEKDRVLRKLKHISNQLKSIQETIPLTIVEREKVHHQVVLSENEKKKVSACVEELKRDFDLQMRNYLGIEAVSKDVSVRLRKGYKEVERLEREVLGSIELEYARHQQMGELSSLREHMCRLLSSKLQMFNEAKEKIRISDLVIGFLKKKDVDLQNYFGKFIKLYNLMRAQRNKFITLIQASKVAMAELKDKLKTLEVEFNMLQGELLYKEKVLHRMRKEFVSSVQSRFHLRAELIKCSKILQQQKDLVDEKLIEVARMNGFINTTEKEMLMFRKKYETCVLDRNHVGISLIDRNDELCILYEKSNVQEELFKISDIEMNKRDNEISFLKHQVGSLERSILICYTFVPKSRELTNTISDLKHELKRVMAEGDRLSDLVERPQNTARWKLLNGKDPSELQLRAKLSFIEDTLSEKEDQSLEKDLILEEISALAEDIKRQAAENLVEGQRIAIQISDYQHHIRTITHRMMSIVSELSLTQATANSLQKEKEALSRMIEESYLKLDEEKENDDTKWMLSSNKKWSLSKDAKYYNTQECCT